MAGSLLQTCLGVACQPLLEADAEVPGCLSALLRCAQQLTLHSWLRAQRPQLRAVTVLQVARQHLHQTQLPGAMYLPCLYENWRPQPMPALPESVQQPCGLLRSQPEQPAAHPPGFAYHCWPEAPFCHLQQ